MRSLEIILEEDLFTATKQNWESCQRLYQGVMEDSFRIWGSTPFSFLVLTLAIHPELLRGAKELVWAWYGYGMGFVSNSDLDTLSERFRRFVAPYPDASARGVALWKSYLAQYPSEPCDLPPVLEGVDCEVPYTVTSCLREMDGNLFLWKRSEGVKNPLLTHILREIQDRYGILPLWSSRRKDAIPYEGLFIQIPSRYLTYFKETCDVGHLSQYGRFPQPNRDDPEASGRAQ